MMYVYVCELAVLYMVERCDVTVLNEVSGMTDIESVITHKYDDLMCFILHTIITGRNNEREVIQCQNTISYILKYLLT